MEEFGLTLTPPQAGGRRGGSPPGVRSRAWTPSAHPFPPLLIPVLALAAEIVYLGFAVAVALLLAFQLRLMRRFTAGEEAVRRVDKTQREAAADARARAEETTKDFEALTGTVRPKLGEMEGRLEDLGGRIEALAAQVAGWPRLRPGSGRRAAGPSRPRGSRGEPGTGWRTSRRRSGTRGGGWRWPRRRWTTCGARCAGRSRRWRRGCRTSWRGTGR